MELGQGSDEGMWWMDLSTQGDEVLGKASGIAACGSALECEPTVQSCEKMRVPLARFERQGPVSDSKISLISFC